MLQLTPCLSRRRPIENARFFLTIFDNVNTGKTDQGYFQCAISRLCIGINIINEPPIIYIDIYI